MSIWGDRASGLYDSLLGAALNFLIAFLLGGALLFVIKFIVTKIVNRNKKFDNTVKSFIISATRLLLNILFAIILLTSAGVPTASVVALLSAAGLAISLSVQDSLSNLVSGILLLINKPFKEDDLIEVNGFMGNIKKINILTTHIFTFDNSTIVIPNNIMSKSAIINYSTQNIRRVVIEVNIDYQSNLEYVKNSVMDIIKNNALVLTSPPPAIMLKDFDSVNLLLSIRTWVKTDDYWTVFFGLREEILDGLKNSNIIVPYNKIDVNFLNKN